MLMRVVALVVVGALTGSACTASGATAVGDGRFVVRDQAGAPQVARVVSQAAKLVNARVALPEDVPIVVSSCTDGTGYDPNDRSIKICVPEVDETRTMLKQAGAADLAAVETSVLLETVTHEAGHALLDVLGASFTGREEDVADQFSAYVLGQDDTKGSDVMEDVAHSYEVSASSFEQDAADEHSSDAQRAINFQCWVYGADVRPSDHLIAKGGLTKARAELCGEEWDDLRKGWNRLLGSAVKE